jgi:hypothetical protein
MEDVGSAKMRRLAAVFLVDAAKSLSAHLGGARDRIELRPTWREQFRASKAGRDRRGDQVLEVTPLAALEFVLVEDLRRPGDWAGTHTNSIPVGMMAWTVGHHGIHICCMCMTSTLWMGRRRRVVRGHGARPTRRTDWATPH